MYLRKIVLFLLIFILSPISFAITLEEGKAAFERYIEYGNKCDQKLSEMYDKDTLIKRIVKRKDGSSVERVLAVDMYKTMIKYYSRIALWRGYKNIYTDIKYKKVGDNVEISCLRHPSTTDDVFKAKIVFGENDFGKIVVKEELFDTKASFLIK